MGAHSRLVAPGDPRSYAKAIVGGLIAAGGVLKVAYGDDTLTKPELIEAVLAFLTGLSVVWATPNAVATGQARRRTEPDDGEPDDGWDGN